MKKIVTVTKTCPEYLENVLEKLDKFDNLKVNGLKAGQLSKIKEENPELFAKIKDKICTDRWYPASGLWQEESGEISNEQLARQILYSARWLKENFNIVFRVFCGKNICSRSFAQIVYNGRFDCAVLTDENENYWLDGEDRFRLFIMSEAETVDFEDIDEKFISENEFETYEELLHKTLSSPLSLKSVKKGRTEDKLTEAEKALILAEKASAQSCIDKSAEIRECWFDIFSGEDEKVAEKAEKIADGKCACDIVKINNADVKVNVFKFAEDGSGSKVIRIEETAGTEKSISVMCDEIDAGFRCEIEPYEIATYKIDTEGFVREPFIFE